MKPVPEDMAIVAPVDGIVFDKAHLVVHTTVTDMSDRAAQAQIAIARAEHTWPAVAACVSLVLICAMLLGGGLYAASQSQWSAQVLVTLIGSIGTLGTVSFGFIMTKLFKRK